MKEFDEDSSLNKSIFATDCIYNEHWQRHYRDEARRYDDYISHSSETDIINSYHENGKKLADEDIKKILIYFIIPQAIVVALILGFTFIF
jgi:hypothetical protein